MDVPITMPSLGNEESEVQVEQWLVAVGDTVNAGDQLVVVNTPKVAMEIEAPATGELTSILAAPDDLIEEGATLGIIKTAD